MEIIGNLAKNKDASSTMSSAKNLIATRRKFKKQMVPHQLKVTQQLSSSEKKCKSHGLNNERLGFPVKTDWFR